MADSPAFQSVTPATLPAGVSVSTEEVTTLNGGPVSAQHVQRFLAAFRTADGTAVDLPGDAANGLDVDVTRVQGTVAVSGPLTDAQLRATPVPVSGTVTVGDGSGPLTVDGTVSVGNFPATQPVSLATNTPDVTDRSARLLGHVTVDSAPTTAVTGPLTDAQLRAAAVPVSGSFFQATQPVSAASLPLPTGAATEATLDTRTGSLTETAPASDTASSGLNGRLQRIAQRLTSLLAVLPGSLGQKTKANSLAVTLASDQDALPASQSGTWTVQPGNTANSTAWKVDGSAVTQPVSGTVSVNALPAGTNNIGDVDVLTLPAIPAGSNNIGQVDPRGNVAHDGADSGNPVKTGGRARTALPAAVAQDDRSDTITDKHGRTLVANAPVDQRTSGRANYTNTTAADVIAAPGASVAIVVTTLLVTNAHATVGTKVELRDGTTVKLIGQASKDGGGFNLHDPDGLFIATANTAVTARCVTTGADVEVFVAGFKIPG